MIILMMMIILSRIIMIKMIIIMISTRVSLHSLISAYEGVSKAGMPEQH